MPTQSNGGARISRRGQWADGFTVYSPGGGTDPGSCIYTVSLWPVEDGCGCSLGDYGRSAASHWRSGGLHAASIDGTGRLTAAATGEGIALAWVFPVAEVQRLAPGAYQGSIVATLGPETIELASFTKVVA